MKILIFFLSFTCLINASEPVTNSIEKIKELILNKEKGAYLNFDDSDFESALGRWWIRSDMLDFVSKNEPNIIKSYTFSHRTLKDLSEKVKLSDQASYGSISAAFLTTSHREKCLQFFELLKMNEVTLVTDIDLSPQVCDLFFGPTCKVIHISSQKIDRVENECLMQLPNDNEHKVVVLMMGKLGKPLAKKLISKSNPILLVDLSYLRTAFSEWNLSDWTSWAAKDDPIVLKNKGSLKVLFTSALIPFKFEERKQEYIHCLKVLENFGYKNEVFVVEATGYSPLSFYSDYSTNALYTNINDRSYVNKGVNEAKSLIAAFNFLDFDDEDMILKITGRYFLNNANFLRLVEANPDIDAFASHCNRTDGWVTTGCFAMRCKYFKQLLKEIDFEHMEKNLIDFEKVVGNYLKKMASENGKVQYLDKIGLRANVANVAIEQW